jgi:hypothetical protein
MPKPIDNLPSGQNTPHAAATPHNAVTRPSRNPKLRRHRFILLRFDILLLPSPRLLGLRLQLLSLRPQKVSLQQCHNSSQEGKESMIHLRLKVENGHRSTIIFGCEANNPSGGSLCLFTNIRFVNSRIAMHTPLCAVVKIQQI